MPTTRPTDHQTTARSTVDVKTLLLVLAMAVALLTAYVVGSVRIGTGTAAAASAPTAAPPAAAPTAEEGTKDVATIVMTGTGKATGVPDQMTFRVGVRSNASDVSTALAQANVTARRVLKTLRDEGVAPKYVTTTGLSIQPVYDYSVDGPAVITGYSAAQSMTVAVKDLQTAGKVLGAAVDAGGNAIRVSDIRLGISDKEALLKRARADAVDEAMTKAAEYADASGRDLDEVISIREVTPGTAISPVPASFDSLRSAVAEVSGIVPIRSGRSPLEVTVVVVWSFA